MAEELSLKKIPRIRGQNFSSMEANLISRNVVEELALLRGKFGFPQQTETSKSRPSQFSIQESSSSDQIYSAEPVSSPIPAQIAVSGCQIADEPPSSVESIWIRRLEQVYQRNEETPYTEHANLSAQIPPSFTNSSTQQPPIASENKRTKKPKRTAEDVYELPCQALESKLKRNQTQMELFQKQMEFYDLIIKILKIVVQSQC
ncbi:unnamed protein product [Mytilus coruscus]|uniref:Uncharacterized protein n=1 Tax=Mytilus coruscus TaxID=42192 RepID=A0A6J8EAJ9_MYTCO|nr:unnamed protein product [Mytilus coruscus]